MDALSREDIWRVMYYRGLLFTKMKTNSLDLNGFIIAIDLSSKKTEE